MLEILNENLYALTNDDVINILKRQQFIVIDEDDINILRKTKISGSNLLLFKKEDFIKDGLATGPSLSVTYFIEKLKEGMID
jgi:hypothetical protein